MYRSCPPCRYLINKLVLLHEFEFIQEKPIQIMENCFNKALILSPRQRLLQSFNEFPEVFFGFKDNKSMLFCLPREIIYHIFEINGKLPLSLNDFHNRLRILNLNPSSEIALYLNLVDAESHKSVPIPRIKNYFIKV